MFRKAAPVIISLAGLLTLFGLNLQSVSADIAPFIEVSEGGYSLAPAQLTSVQMVSETVLIEISEALPFAAVETGFITEKPGGHVTADFLFRNPHGAAQSLFVGFPLYIPPVINPNNQGNFSGSFVIEDLRASVNGVDLPTEQTTVNGQPWRVWRMTFAPGETRAQVTYKLPVAVPGPGAARATLGYVFHTGAGWAGVIESVELRVRFPYTAEALFVEDGQTGFTVAGNELIWQYQVFEPTPADDLTLSFVNPQMWRTVLQVRPRGATVRLEDHVALAGVYSNITSAYDWFILRGSPLLTFNSLPLTQAAEAEYQAALALDPNNVTALATYANFLTTHAGTLLSASRRAEARQSYQRALDLSPGALAVRQDYERFLQAFPTEITAADLASATAIALITPNTPTPTLTVTPSPTSPSNPAFFTRTPTATATFPPATPTSPPTTPPLTTADEEAFPWPTVIGFTVAFAVIVGGILLLRRRTL